MEGTLNRALYHDGWIAVCRPGRLPWQNSGSFSFDEDKWELYNIETDFSESNDLSAQNPKKLRELQDMFWAEAAKYNVLPLDDRFAGSEEPSLKGCSRERVASLIVPVGQESCGSRPLELRRPKG